MALTKAFAIAFGHADVATSFTSGTFDSTGYTHLVVSAKHEGAAATITISDNKSSSVVITGTKESHTNGDLHGQMFALAIGSPGTGQTVTVNLSATRAWKSADVWLVNASNGAGIQLDVEAFAEGSGSAVDAGTLSTTGVSVVSFMYVAPYASGSYTPGSGWTEDQDGASDGVSHAGFSRGPETTSPIDPAATWTNTNDWCAVAMSLREPSAGGTKALPIQPIRNFGALLSH